MKTPQRAVLASFQFAKDFAPHAVDQYFAESPINGPRWAIRVMAFFANSSSKKSPILVIFPEFVSLEGMDTILGHSFTFFIGVLCIGFGSASGQALSPELEAIILHGSRPQPGVVTLKQSELQRNLSQHVGIRQQSAGRNSNVQQSALIAPSDRNQPVSKAREHANEPIRGSQKLAGRELPKTSFGSGIMLTIPRHEHAQQPARAAIQRRSSSEANRHGPQFSPETGSFNFDRHDSGEDNREPSESVDAEHDRPRPKPAPVSTALPYNFLSNQARPKSTTGVRPTAASFGSASLARGRSVPRAAGIPSSPMIMPAGAGRQRSLSRLRAAGGTCRRG